MRKFLLIGCFFLTAKAFATDIAFTDPNVHAFAYSTSTTAGFNSYTATGYNAPLIFSFYGSNVDAQLYSTSSTFCNIDGGVYFSTHQPATSQFGWVSLASGLTVSTHTVKIFGTLNASIFMSTAAFRTTGNGIVEDPSYGQGYMVTGSSFTSYGAIDGGGFPNQMALNSLFNMGYPGLPVATQGNEIGYRWEASGSSQTFVAIADIFFDHPGFGALYQNGVQVSTISVPYTEGVFPIITVNGLNPADSEYELLFYTSTATYNGLMAIMPSGTLAANPHAKKTLSAIYGDSIAYGGPVATDVRTEWYEAQRQAGFSTMHQGYYGYSVSEQPGGGSGLKDLTSSIWGQNVPSSATIVVHEGGVNDPFAFGISSVTLSTSAVAEMQTMATNLPAGSTMFWEGILPNNEVGASTTIPVYVVAESSAVNTYNLSPVNGTKTCFYHTTGWINPTTDTADGIIHPAPSNGPQTNYPYGNPLYGYGKIENNLGPLLAGYGPAGASYTSSGPTSGASGVASSNFVLVLGASATWTGTGSSTQTITLNDGANGGTFTFAGGSGLGPIISTPTIGMSSFTFTYTPTSSGVKTISFTAGQDCWINPASLTYTATGGPAITQGPKLFALTHDSVTGLYVTSMTASQTTYGVDSVSHSSYSALSGNYAYHQYAGEYISNLYNHEFYASALLPGTTYYYRACATNGTENCSPESSFVTLSTPTPHPALPTLPQAAVDTTMPTCANGMLHCTSGTPVTYTVGSDCDDPTTGLQALFDNSQRGDTIIIPTTTYCGGYYDLTSPAVNVSSPNLTNVVESSAVSLLPPSGTRIKPSDSVNMPYMEQTQYGVNWTTGPPAVDYCTPGGYNWTIYPNTAPGWYMSYCADVQKVNISSISFIGSDGNYSRNQYAVIASTAISATLPYDTQWCGIYGTGLWKGDASCHVVGGATVSSVTIDTIADYDPTNTGIAVGSTSLNSGTIQFYDFITTVPYTSYSGSSPTVSCVQGQWAYSNQTPAGGALTGNYELTFANDTNYSSGRIWRCTDTNHWTRWVPVTAFGSSRPGQVAETLGAVLSLGNVSHARFIGLNFSNTTIPPDPNMQDQGHEYSPTSGDNPIAYVATDFTSDHILFDRCYFHDVYPTKAATILQLDGSYIGLVDSDINIPVCGWTRLGNRGAYFDSGYCTAINLSAMGPTLLQNNYLEAYGITVHYDDGHSGVNLVNHDATIRQNTFYRNLALIDGTSGSTVNYYQPLRQLLELKRGFRFSVDGNVFNGNFQNVSAGAALEFTTQPMESGSLGFECFLISSNSVSYTCSNDGVVNFKVGDWIYDDSTGNGFGIITSTQIYASSFTITMSSYTGLGSGEFYFDASPDSEGIYDISITNNIFENMPVVSDVVSRLQIFYGQPLDRLMFKNNLLYNWGTGANGGLKYADNFAWQTAGATGNYERIAGGVSDNILNHNTSYQFVPPAGAFNLAGTMFIPFEFAGTSVQENEALQYINNIQWSTTYLEPVLLSGLNGDNVLNLWYAGTLPYALNNNVTIRSGANPGNYQSPNVWASSSTASAFYSIPNNFALANSYRAQDTCYSVPGDCTTDGLDEGVLLPALIAAQGSNYPFGTTQSGVTIRGRATIRGSATIR